jgi:hypothetical protein
MHNPNHYPPLGRCRPVVRTPIFSVQKLSVALQTDQRRPGSTAVAFTCERVPLMPRIRLCGIHDVVLGGGREFLSSSFLLPWSRLGERQKTGRGISPATSIAARIHCVTVIRACVRRVQLSGEGV